MRKYTIVLDDTALPVAANLSAGRGSYLLYDALGITLSLGLPQLGKPQSLMFFYEQTRYGAVVSLRVNFPSAEVDVLFDMGRESHLARLNNLRRQPRLEVFQYEARELGVSFVRSDPLDITMLVRRNLTRMLDKLQQYNATLTYDWAKALAVYNQDEPATAPVMTPS